jgi:hypothetical protein
MAPRKITLPGILFVATLFVLAIICYFSFHSHFFSFCFGLAALLATISLLTRQRLN